MKNYQSNYRSIIYCLLFYFAFTPVKSQNLNLDGQIYSVDTLANHLAGPGTQYTRLRLTGPSSLDVYFLKTDLKNKYVDLRMVLANDSIGVINTPSSIAKKKNKTGEGFYFAGVNGDFFDNYINTTFYIRGFGVVDRQIVQYPIPQLYSKVSFAISEPNKEVNIGSFSYNANFKSKEKTYSIDCVNRLDAIDKIVLFNNNMGTTTGTTYSGVGLTEVLVELLPGQSWQMNNTIKAKTVSVKKNTGNMFFQHNQAVLSSYGAGAAILYSISIGDTIEITQNLTLNNTIKLDFSHVVSGDCFLLKDGEIGSFLPSDHPYPRTGVGYSQNKDTLIFCVVEGKNTEPYHGLKLKQLAKLIEYAGAYNALNLDGGGSSTMYIEGYNGPVNVPADLSGERPVPNALYIVSTAPNDSMLNCIRPQVLSKKIQSCSVFIPSFYKYNKYGHLLNRVDGHISLSCPSNLGVVFGENFIASGTGAGYITAKYNEDIETKIYVKIIP